MTYIQDAHFALEQMNKALGRNSVTGATVMAAEAQALATLAVAEELRTANLLAYMESGVQMSGEGRVSIRADIRSRLEIDR